jgi:hypothetical protein
MGWDFGFGNPSNWGYGVQVVHHDGHHDHFIDYSVSLYICLFSRIPSFTPSEKF